jgi:mono/diheme cytochrome c family protein
MAAHQKQTKPAGRPDPIAGRSLSGPVLVVTLVLGLLLAGALYDELFYQRPWKRYQKQFVAVYTSYLKKMVPEQAAAEKVVEASPEFQEIERQLQAAELAAGPRASEIDRQLRLVREQLAAIKGPFQDARARLASFSYELDHAGSPGKKNSLQQDLEEVRKGPFRISLPADDGSGPLRPASYTFDDLERRFTELTARDAQLVAEQAAVTKDARELRKKRNEFLSDHLAGLNQRQMEGLLRKMENFKIEIKQIHIPEAGLVDRCESCHLGIREPLALMPAELGGRQLFVSHPNKTLLTLHDPSRFGCTLCHNGNGSATTSAEKAHGNYSHWPWPMFARENSEAGCLQCHFNDRVLEQAPVLTRGRDLFQMKGCVGCHRHEEFDREMDGLAATRQQIQNLENQRKLARLELARETKKSEEAASDQEAEQHYARAESLRVTSSSMDARVAELDQNAKFLMRDVKKAGPNLKDVRLKLRKEWIPVWLQDPPAFRPGTKMPKFRLPDEEIRAISAFLWQAALEGPRPAPQPKGDPVAGKELFETRGCLACHSIGEGTSRFGGEFAANLSRLGEKANYDYIVRWVHNPRERTRPYCPREKRDLGPEDYARHGLPFVFDLQHSTCPNDGFQLQVQNMTVMPSLRLSWEEARDIAAYLTGLERSDASYPADVSFLDDTKLANQGRQLVNRYGCGSCHEIGGFEDAPRPGTELTKEASKPVEQFDFGLLIRKAKREGWYSQKGFFEHKLQDPSLFDQGREKAPADRLRMPNIQLAPEDVRALTTFLLGSLDTPFQGEFRTIPEPFRYVPSGPRKDVQEGWWLVRKYNCTGCHNIDAGQKSVLSGLPRYQRPEWIEQLPPSLVQEGARVNPEWLAHFLANPALSTTETARNGVRTYLKARMPTFSFSPNEIGILVRFFEAMQGQPNPYIPSPLDPLDERERRMSAALFSSQQAPCLNCHLIGEPSHDRLATAPNFLIAKDRLKPDWTTRWMIDPQAISPGTNMPSGLFRQEGERWVFAGPTPDTFQGYNKDHVQLLVRYMFQLTPQEQRRLIQMIPIPAAQQLSSPDAAATRTHPGAQPKGQ